MEEKKNPDVNDVSEMPVLPHALIEMEDKFNPPKYEGDLEDWNARKNHKLFQLWLSWSDLRKSVRLMDLIRSNEKDDIQHIELKYTISVIMDRFGKIMSDGNILEEIQH